MKTAMMVTKSTVTVAPPYVEVNVVMDYSIHLSSNAIMVLPTATQHPTHAE